jgi:hypothetical protein
LPGQTPGNLKRKVDVSPRVKQWALDRASDILIEEVRKEIRYPLKRRVVL